MAPKSFAHAPLRSIDQCAQLHVRVDWQFAFELDPGVGHFQQVRLEKRGHGARDGGFTGGLGFRGQGRIALCRGLGFGLLCALQALTGESLGRQRAGQPNSRPHDAREQGDDKARGCQHRPFMPTQELSQPIGGRRRTGLHRFVM